MTQLATQRRSEQGFTLVELAIVMVIIGLLIAGILKGQELIANARLSATVSQLKGLDAAMNTFQDKYNALPGDMTSPNTRLPGCGAAPCSTAGDGNARISDVNLGNAPAIGNEEAVAFAHLSAADLISGVDVSTATVAFGQVLPSVRAGGGMWVGYFDGANGGLTTLQGGRHYAVLNGTVAAVGGTTGAFTPAIAAQIDRKIDDGIINTGTTQATGTNCASTVTAGAYDEANTTALCAMYSRVLN